MRDVEEVRAMSELLTKSEVAVVSATFNGRAQTMPEIIETLQAANGLWYLCVDLATDIAEAHKLNSP